MPVLSIVPATPVRRRSELLHPAVVGAVLGLTAFFASITPGADLIANVTDVLAVGVLLHACAVLVRVGLQRSRADVPAALLAVVALAASAVVTGAAFAALVR
jgi:hypothetical protein